MSYKKHLVNFPFKVVSQTENEVVFRVNEGEEIVFPVRLFDKISSQDELVELVLSQMNRIPEVVEGDSDITDEYYDDFDDFFELDDDGYYDY